jgi:hypothetical protein
MATYKTLDDYWMRSNGFKELYAKICQDFKTGVIDEHNYEELVEELQDEIDEARIEYRFSSRRARNGNGA